MDGVRRHRFRQPVKFLLGQETGALALAKHHHVAQTGRFADGEVPGVGLVGEAWQGGVQAGDEVDLVRYVTGRDQGNDVAVIEDVGQLVGLVTGIDRYRDRPAESNGEEVFDEFQARRQEKADVVPGLDAERLETACAIHRPAGQFPVSELLGREDDGVRVRVAVGRGQQQITDRRHGDTHARQ